MHKLFLHKILRMMKFSSIRISPQQFPFYGFRPKNVRFPNQKRTFSDAKPYVFGTETVKGYQLKQQ